MRLFCLFGFHTRSRRQVRDEGGFYVSNCRYCRKPMKKMADGSWAAVRDESE